MSDLAGNSGAETDRETRGTRALIRRQWRFMVLATAFCGLFVWTWRKLPDVLIDFGRELYVPWRLSEGAVLYRDVAYFNGPFTPYFNTMLFRYFGVSYTVLMIANAAIFVFLAALVYRFLARRYDRNTAFIGGMVLLTVFGFAHLVGVGNYNYITPYSHELPHGLTLALLALVLLTGALPKISTLRALAAGVCLGLVFLGKAEIFAAAIVACGAALTLPLIGRAISPREWFVRCAALIAAMAWPPALFTAVLARHMPVSEAALSVAGTWPWIFGSDVSSQYYYKAIAGFHYPAFQLLASLKAVVCVAGVVTIIAIYDRLSVSVDRRWRAVLVLFAIALVGLLALLRGRPFPFLIDGPASLAIAGGLTLAYLASAWRYRSEETRFSRYAALSVMAIFALLLLAKTPLAPRVFHYGVFLAMPATIMAAAFLIGAAPRLVCGSWGGGAAFRKAIIAVLLVDMLGYVLTSSVSIRAKSHPIGRGADTLTAYHDDKSPVGLVVSRLLEVIEQEMDDDDTFVVLPEGVMLNYLTRRRNPTPYINFMPPELMMYSEPVIIDALESSKPDYILLVHKDTKEYGVELFGSPEYGGEIMQWVRSRYRSIETIRHRPLCCDEFGAEVLVRRRDVERGSAQVSRPRRNLRPRVSQSTTRAKILGDLRSAQMRGRETLAQRLARHDPALPAPSKTALTERRP